MTSPPRTDSRRLPISRAQRKAQLLVRIEQQRIDLLVDAQRWHLASQPLDAGWRQLMCLKPLLLAVGGVVLVRGVRRPGRLARLGRRLAAAALVASRGRRLLRLLR